MLATLIEPCSASNISRASQRNCQSLGPCGWEWLGYSTPRLTLSTAGELFGSFGIFLAEPIQGLLERDLHTVLQTKRREAYEAPLEMALCSFAQSLCFWIHLAFLSICLGPSTRTCSYVFLDVARNSQTEQSSCLFAARQRSLVRLAMSF